MSHVRREQNQGQMRPIINTSLHSAGHLAGARPAKGLGGIDRREINHHKDLGKTGYSYTAVFKASAVV